MISYGALTLPVSPRVLEQDAHIGSYCKQRGGDADSSVLSLHRRSFLLQPAECVMGPLMPDPLRTPRDGPFV